ncbi:hypothetical protein E8E13_000965 [Curvularia kusanoi]|uniref:Uncharacterized protein n=1 Tax=Curvularia kusanoi TaxID=90978 RepID=A0A9P4T3I3_CURKU|nr:hypothetical protein E8E13_000965 [Curvularia kusanoi]
MRDLMVIDNTITPDWIRLSANPQNFQVTAAVNLPQYMPPPSLGGFPVSATYLNAKMEEVVAKLPAITRSLAVVLKPHPQCTGQSLEIIWTDFCGSMHYYLHHAKWEVTVGKLDLRNIQVFVANPVAFAVEVHYGPFQRKIPGIDVIGLKFTLTRNGACRMRIIMPPDQRFQRFTKDCMKLVYRTMGRLSIGYKRGCLR